MSKRASVEFCGSFACRIQATTITSLDVAEAQTLIHQHLKMRYQPDKRLTLLPSAASIRTTSVSKFSRACPFPPNPEKPWKKTHGAAASNSLLSPEGFASATAAPTNAVTEQPRPSSSTSVTTDGHTTSKAWTSTSLTTNGHITGTTTTFTSVTSSGHATSAAPTSAQQVTSMTSTSVTSEGHATSKASTSAMASTYTTRAANFSGESVNLHKSCFNQKLKWW